MHRVRKEREMGAWDNDDAVASRKGNGGKRGGRGSRRMTILRLPPARIVRNEGGPRDNDDSVASSKGKRVKREGGGVRVVKNKLKALGTNTARRA